jgi:hypothetical protein
MKAPLPIHLSPRCTAMSKRTKQRCRAPAVTGWTVCRFHGARGGGPKGARNGSYRSGQFTAEAVAKRRACAGLLRRVRRTLSGLSEDS